MEHPMGSAWKGFTYEITPQSRRASSLKFRLSLCTVCTMFFRLWSLFLACVGADYHIYFMNHGYLVYSAYIRPSNFLWPWFSGRIYGGIHCVTIIYILHMVYTTTHPHNNNSHLLYTSLHTRKHRHITTYKHTCVAAHTYVHTHAVHYKWYTTAHPHSISPRYTQAHMDRGTHTVIQ